MKYLLSTFLLLLLFGCGSDSGTTQPQDPQDNDPVPPPVISLEPATQNPLFTQQWAINYDQDFYASNGISANASINTQDILERYSGKTVRVAVIDDGFDALHPELIDNVIVTKGVNSDLSISESAAHLSSLDYHGTAVAGIIGAKNNTLGIMGLASDVSLILIRIPMDDYSDAASIKAFDLAQSYGADIINCSWGTGDISDALRAKITDLAINGRDGKGILVVFASGNEDALMLNDESSLDEVLGVGATDREGLRSLYSSYGPDLDISAPGGDLLGITTIDPLGTDGNTQDEYNRYNERADGYEISFIGTSAAAPIISASLALALQADPSLTRQELYEHLAYTNERVGQSTPYLYDMVRSNSTTPRVSGIFGTTEYSDFEVRLISNTTQITYGPYAISNIGNNEWQAAVTEPIPEGQYTIEVFVQVDKFTDVIYATDTSFIIDTSLYTYTNKDLLHSDFYGYGKIDLYKLIERITN